MGKAGALHRLFRRKSVFSKGGKGEKGKGGEGAFPKNGRMRKNKERKDSFPEGMENEKKASVGKMLSQKGEDEKTQEKIQIVGRLVPGEGEVGRFKRR